MRENFYITKDGMLKRKENTVYFVRKDENGQLERRILPINKIQAIFAYGRLSFTSAVASYLAKNGIPVHFFSRKRGFYEATLYPRETLVSGDVLVRQAEHYLVKEKRLELAREFVRGCAGNMVKNLQYYQRNERALEEEIASIAGLEKDLDRMEEIPQVLSIEGNMWSTYYHALDSVLPEPFRMGARVKRPPNNMLNCLISFGNSLLYTTVLTEIYNTQLNPCISYLHEPSARRFSLSLDISEVFKPFIVGRVIFKLVNKGIIQQEHFDTDLNSCLLTEKGRYLFLQHYDEKLKTTIKHRSLGRNVSYQTLIRLECYKIIKHLLDADRYKAFTMWW